MPINYAKYVSEIAAITAISSTVLESGDNNFSGIMPGIIDYAEGRLYRDLDLPATTVTSTATVCSSGVRSISLSTAAGTLLVLEAVNLLTSAGAPSSAATRVPLMPASKAVIDTVYPSAATAQTGQPEFFARITDTQLILGPTPDAPYGTEITATIRPNPLSASNSSTWLTQNVPELMVAAGMIFASGYMRNYGSQSDDPRMSVSWESQYQALLGSQKIDTLRMKFMSDAWTSQQPNAVATPPRG
jgi:hypothetical protein